MESKKQTAVEWLANQLEKGLIGDDAWFNVLQQAKQMEKEQICDSYVDGRNSIINREVIPVKQYYNETFGKDEF